MTFEVGKLIIILGGTLFLGSLALLAARGMVQRLMLLGLLGGLIFYNGIGAASSVVAPVYIVYYFGTLIAVIIGFYFGRIMFLPVGRIVGRRLPHVLGDIDRKPEWLIVIVAYIALSAFPLVWPEFRLHHLFAPQLPDLREIFFRSFTEEPDALSKVVGYARLLLMPFFYLALYRFRYRLRWIAALFAILLYTKYIVKFNYIGRGDVMMHVGLLVMAVWILRPKYRRAIVVIGFAVLPLLLYGFYIYGRIRIGGSSSGIGFGKAIVLILEQELSYPQKVGMPILEAGAHCNLTAYFTWIATLPIPKIITGSIEGARINYEISEIILGLPTGAHGWYVVLPGLVAESVYIYGPYFFWLHGMFLGGFAALFVRLMERVPQLFFLYLYVVLMFAYVLNRAGISALLPPMVNQFLLFYLFLVFWVFRFRVSSRKCGIRVPNIYANCQ